MIPCKECITYAICKHKQQLRCDMVFYHMIRNYSNLNNDDFWKLIRQTLPRVQRLIPNTNGLIWECRNDNML